MRAWVYQDSKQVRKHGADQASWYVGWLDPAGKRRCQSCGKGSRGKTNAERLRRKVEAELLTGTYQSNSKKTWAEFRVEYEEKVLPGMAARSQEEVKFSLGNFARIIKPGKMTALKTTTIDAFIAKRRLEPGKKKGDFVSPATINKDLRHLRAALRKAQRWGYLAVAPEIDLEKEPKKLPRYVLPEHFAAIYQACEVAKMPADLPYPAADWWRALLVCGYMTGWRISALLALRREDVDLNTGTALSRHADNKGKRDERIPLHPVIVDHLRRVPSFDSYIFPWKHFKTTLYDAFAEIQVAAKIKLICPGSHEHTAACLVYGFHDLRRAFATMNADKLTPDALQALMQHRSYSTTQRYISMARQLDQAVQALHVPEVLRKVDNS